jgi:hypothetical protein
MSGFIAIAVAILKAIATLPAVIKALKELDEQNRNTSATQRKLEKDAAVDAAITAVRNKQRVPESETKQL